MKLMIKTIKIKKEMNFRELMEYIIQNDVSGEFESNHGDKFLVDAGVMFKFYEYDYDIGELYKVDVMEEITEEMEFRVLIEIFSKTHTITHNFKSVKEIKDDGTEKIYALIDGELQKVWQRCEENDR